MTFYTVPELEQGYGKNYQMVFSGSRCITKVNPKEYKEILETIKRGKCIDATGKIIPVVDMAGEEVVNGKLDTSTWGIQKGIRSVENVLYVLGQYTWMKDGPGHKKGDPLFKDFMLPTYDASKGIQGFGDKGQVNWANLFINYEVQRTINFYNIIKYLMRFDSKLVFGAKGRYETKTNRYFANDGQHCIILICLAGASWVPMIWIQDENLSTDVDQFLSFSVDAYQTEEFDQYRSQFRRAELMVEHEGKDPYKEDQIPLGLHDMLSSVDCKFIPTAKTPQQGECKTIKRMKKYMEEYVGFDEVWQRYFYDSEKPDIMGLALRLERRAFKHHPLKHEPIGGLCKLIEAQGKLTQKQIETLFDTIPIALRQRWPQGPHMIWDEVNATINKQFDKSKPQTRDDYRNKESARWSMIGTAIKDVVDAYVEMVKRSPGNQIVKDPKLSPIMRDETTKVTFNGRFPNNFDSKFIKEVA